MNPLNQPKNNKSKPGPRSVLSCTPQCPRIVPGSSQGPPGRQSKGTKHAEWHPWAPKSKQKSGKNKTWTSKCPLLCYLMSQNQPRVPQVAKSEATNHAKWQVCVTKKPNPFTTMPRICDPKAMSNGWGPAAEGVANEIISIHILTKCIDISADKVKKWRVNQRCDISWANVPNVYCKEIEWNFDRKDSCGPCDASRLHSAPSNPPNLNLVLILQISSCFHFHSCES